jgi:Rab GDP dissociation inhibitor
MDQEYDAIVLGTGLKECIISGLLSVSGMKVLHMDRNSYYGGEFASLNLTQLWERFKPGQPVPKELGSSRDYNVDLVPKFIMANGKLVRVLIYTDVTKYLEFKAVDGSYVLSKGKVYKVPATDMEALRSPLMGLFEKRRARGFFVYVQDYDEKNPATYKGLNLHTMPMSALYAHFGLDAQTIDFIGHALALHRDDNYLDQPALPTVMKIKLYHDSLLLRWPHVTIHLPTLRPGRATTGICAPECCVRWHLHAAQGRRQGGPRRGRQGSWCQQRGRDSQVQVCCG